MVQNNKVLTVSYGTFSCTLEGFDDSFETMKAIAEYFRDLAADDRYFGSEPPQPDAEMLTRIAQRDASRRVEASQSETGLLLRATDETPAVTPQPVAPPAPAAEAPAQPAAPSPDLSVVNTPPAASAEAAYSDAEPVEPAKPFAADSIAAKLQRIRAVVSHSDDQPTPSYSEDEETGFLATPEPQVDAISAAFEAGALDPADLDTPEQALVPEDAAEVEDVTEVQETEVEEAEADEPLVDQPEGEQPDEPAAEDVPVEALEDFLAEDTLTGSVEAFADEMEEATEKDHAELGETEPEAAEDEPAPEVLFTDLEDEAEAEVEADDILNLLDEDTSEEAEEEETLEAEEGILTAEDEENILGAISEIESEMESRAEKAHSESQNIDSDVFRLLDKADAQLDDPASSDTRETYSHLRTAVAATEAERAETGKTPESEDQKYRGDLASVVSPRRPEVHVTSTRPQADTAAPLKLVAEQRIDTEDGDAGPVTPRRVTAAQEEDDASEEGGFAHFAQEQGAQSLPDLLEAAAAYLSFVEGQEQFSRPQLMNKVRSFKQDEFNREESLRSFGQLLRDGKIEKAGGGRFAASNQIGFRPDDKRAAG